MDSRITANPHCSNSQHACIPHRINCYLITSPQSRCNLHPNIATYDGTMSECAFPLFWRRTDPSKGGVNGYFFWAHVHPTYTTINVGGGREECISSVDTLGGDTTLRSHCGVKKDIPILQFVWHFAIKWICLSMLLIKGSAFNFFHVDSGWWDDL